MEKGNDSCSNRKAGEGCIPRMEKRTRSVSTEPKVYIVDTNFFYRLQDEMGLMLTPFERNIEVWRQLWRVVERSHLIVQIVDARNPLRFRCDDLESYVKSVEGVEGEHGSGPGHRKTLLLINKADLLTARQRLAIHRKLIILYTILLIYV